ncbi:BMP family lipoprotein [Pontivivens insulae]|uniref:Membrane lipoprotein TmpC n=1 Tax=Pontivivens insulae TaxID=1639689 RepID=A0A2R8ADM9_9RHOB|nr:BMP family ABC transporter substrate-binding protein [Pontivivens insulae]RED14272.1 nucleoside-binding protein [Pontivivens insulae]SPF30347.1 Membrane lipoprotein TmpC [Pontivivens insulae]
MKRLAFASAFVALSITFPAHADGPVLFYDGGEKFDASFNESAYNGAVLYQQTEGGSFSEVILPDSADRIELMRDYARQGFEPIVAIGFLYGEAVDTVAAEFPNTDFAIVDMVVDQPNVRSVVFREHEGSYLMGMMAAMASESGTVGFVGGMDIPVIHKFACGYVGGVRAVNPAAEVLVEMTGTTPAAFNNPARGEEIAEGQIAAGADVIYHASGGTGVGVLDAAADAGILGIGVDMNQNGLEPGSVLTSMLKQVDYAVYFALKDSADGNFTYGVQSLGLEDRGVGYAVDQHNQFLVDRGMVAQVETASFGIISGDIAVHDYMSDNACPY